MRLEMKQGMVAGLQTDPAYYVSRKYLPPSSREISVLRARRTESASGGGVEQWPSV